MKKWKCFSVVLLILILACGCSDKAQKEEKEDWVLKEVDKYNNESIRQIDIEEDKETSSGEMVKDQTVILDQTNKLVYIHMLIKGPGDEQEEYTNFLGIDDSQAFNIYKYGSQGEYSKTTDITEDSVNDYLNGRKLVFSEEAEIKIIGEDKINNKKTIKVEVKDPDFQRLQDKEEYKEMIKEAKASDKEEYQKEYDKYMELKEKSWTLWFTKDSHKLERVSYDNSVEEAFELYLLQTQDFDSTIMDQKPIKGTTTWNIKMGDESDKILLPEVSQNN